MIGVLFFFEILLRKFLAGKDRHCKKVNSLNRIFDKEVPGIISIFIQFYENGRSRLKRRDFIIDLFAFLSSTLVQQL